MARSAQQSRLVLAVLVAVLGVLAYVNWPGSLTPGVGAGPGAPRAADDGSRVPQVRLEALESAVGSLGESRRNLFELQSEAPEPERPFVPPDQSPTTAPALPSGPPPIALKFIGIVEGPDAVGVLAILSDGQFVYHGRSGDVIEGRYRIVGIGEESIEMEYLSGQGRQTIRLSGS